MKKLTALVIILIIILLVCNTNAQTEKGVLLLGGGTKLNFSSLNTEWKTDYSSDNPTNTLEIELSPRMGMFIADDLLLGAEVPLKLALVKNNSESKNTDWSVAVAPFVRYFFGETNIKPWVQGQIGLGYLKSKAAITSYSIGEVRNATYTNRSGMFLYEFGGGFSVFINENAALDIGLGYASAALKPMDDNENNGRVIIRGLGAVLGFVLFL